MISLSTFLFVSICEVAIEVFSAQTAYSANLAAVSLTAIGCTGELNFTTGLANQIKLNSFQQFNSPVFMDSPVCFLSNTLKLL